MTDARMPIAARPLHRLDQSPRREPRQQLLEQHTQLQTREVRTQAVVHTLTEPQVWVGLTRDIERVGIIEYQRIAVGRTLPDLHLLARLDLVTPQRRGTRG